LTNTWFWVPLDKVVRWLLAYERMAEQSCVLSLIILRESTLGRLTNIGEPSCWECRSPMLGFTLSATQRSPLHIQRQCHVVFKGGDNMRLWSLPPSQTTMFFLIKFVDKHCIFKDATFLDLISRKKIALFEPFAILNDASPALCWMPTMCLWHNPVLRCCSASSPGWRWLRLVHMAPMWNF